MERFLADARLIVKKGRERTKIRITENSCIDNKWMVLFIPLVYIVFLYMYTII
ncbi:MAG: hypothetical protein H6Q59_127 [Firmicutes bacterium]|nr:hypothetical protein [Bacillota bacterium]